ncbi:MAG: TolC family protein [Saprospiraceae bacterium]|nr:MAG: TolC family protein [Saprospiraceae bacterium]
MKEKFSTKITIFPCFCLHGILQRRSATFQKSQNMKNIFLFAAWLFICPVLYAQPQPINLEAVLTLGGAQNLTIEEYRHRQALAAAGLARAREWWLPDLSAGISTHQLNGAALNGNGKFYLGIEQRSLWAGVQAEARWDFADGIFKTNAAKRRAEAMQFFSKAERNKALLETIETYYDFLAAQLSWQAWQQLAAQADSIARQVEVQVQAGLRYESEGFLAKANLSHLKVEALNSRAAFGKATAALVRLLDLGPGTALVSTDTLLEIVKLETGNWGIEAAPPISQFPISNFTTAHEPRPEMQGMNLNLQALQAERKTTTTGLLLPELQVNAYASRFGGLFGEVRPVDAAAFPNPDVLYPTEALNVSLVWRIPLGRLAYAGELKQYDARIGIQQVQIKQQQAQINEEIIVAREQLLAAKEQMDVAKQGSELAGEALRQSMQRQELGTVRPFEILQAQEVFIKTRLDYVRAVAAHNKAQYGLWVAMGGDL